MHNHVPDPGCALRGAKAVGGPIFDPFCCILTHADAISSAILRLFGATLSLLQAYLSHDDYSAYFESPYPILSDTFISSLEQNNGVYLKFVFLDVVKLGKADCPLDIIRNK